MVRVTLRFFYTIILETSDPAEALDTIISKWEKPHSLFPVPELGRMVIEKTEDGKIGIAYPAKIMVEIEKARDLKDGILEAIRIALPELNETLIEIEAHIA